MLFVMTYKVHQATRNAAQDRFRKSGGSRRRCENAWTVALRGRIRRGGACRERRPGRLTQWSQDWSDAISLETRPASRMRRRKVLGA